MTDKQKPNQTSKITQLYLDFCKEREVKPKLDEKYGCIYSIVYSAENGNILNLTTFNDEDEYMSVYNYTTIKLAESKLLNLYKLANEINQTLSCHSLVLLPKDRKVIVKNGASYSSILCEAGLLKDALESGVSALDQFIPAINLVNYGVMGVDKALETAERFSSTQNMELDLPN